MTAAQTPGLTAEERRKLVTSGAMVPAPAVGLRVVVSAAVEEEVKELEAEWRAALGRARAAFEALAAIEARYCTVYRKAVGRRLLRKNLDPYAVPERDDL